MVAAGLKGDVIFGALSRIVATTRITDGFETSDVVIDHELEVTIPGGRTHRIHVMETDLKDPSTWVGRAPGRARVRRPIDTPSNLRLENTIREFDTGTCCRRPTRSSAQVSPARFDDHEGDMLGDHQVVNMVSPPWSSSMA